jgi:hypothetical protein
MNAMFLFKTSAIVEILIGLALIEATDARCDSYNSSQPISTDSHNSRTEQNVR